MSSVKMDKLDDLRRLFKHGGKDSLVRWVCDCRDGQWMLDASENGFERRLRDLSEGVWSLDDEWLNFKDRKVFDLAKNFILQKLRSDEPMGRELRELAARILDGSIRPDGRGRPSDASTVANTSLAYDCISQMQEIGITPYVSAGDWAEGFDQPTGCQIVGEALGVSTDTVTKWWKAFTKHKKDMRLQEG
jgi:hypothetical protein